MLTEVGMHGDWGTIWDRVNRLVGGIDLERILGRLRSQLSNSLKQKRAHLLFDGRKPAAITFSRKPVARRRRIYLTGACILVASASEMTPILYVSLGCHANLNMKVEGDYTLTNVVILLQPRGYSRGWSLMVPPKIVVIKNCRHWPWL